MDDEMSTASVEMTFADASCENYGLLKSGNCLRLF